jgi:antitoxin component YwqK of YwqJK toxin-antitoxin module
MILLFYNLLTLDMNIHENESGGRTYWHENGNKSSEDIRNSDGKQILYTEWYPNGQKRYEGTWKDGELISEKSFNEDGSEMNWKE